MLKSLQLIWIGQNWHNTVLIPDDISDDDLHELSQASLQRTAADPSYDGRPMDQSTALVCHFHLC